MERNFPGQQTIVGNLHRGPTREPRTSSEPQPPFLGPLSPPIGRELSVESSTSTSTIPCSSWPQDPDPQSRISTPRPTYRAPKHNPFRLMSFRRVPHGKFRIDRPGTLLPTHLYHHTLRNVNVVLAPSTNARTLMVSFKLGNSWLALIS